MQASDSAVAGGGCFNQERIAMIPLAAIISFLGPDVLAVHGAVENISVRHLRPVETVDGETLDWIGNQKGNRQQLAERSGAKAILCDRSVLYSEAIRSSGKVLVQVANPRLALSLVAARFFAAQPASGIHPSAVVHGAAKISASAYIGAHCSLGRCTVGDGTRIHDNVTICDGVSIGSRTVIQAGAVIGTDGLGCERRPDGSLVKFPHLGGVAIGDDVEIGANCQIARGALSDTTIGNGCKINGLCFIAHNCVLGKNVWITGNTMLAGSTRVEDNVTIYSQVVVREQRTIGRGAVVGMGSVVLTDIPAGETWLGNPAKRHQK